MKERLASCIFAGRFFVHTKYTFSGAFFQPFFSLRLYATSILKKVKFFLRTRQKAGPLGYREETANRLWLMRGE
ncbi:hypothetical protein UYO_1688 [Lachnospiraceae bacterium JC7]|nr:hypothetical protein UYO_1688 [Lachnospiraceae bacterium JC7]